MTIDLKTLSGQQAEAGAVWDAEPGIGGEYHPDEDNPSTVYRYVGRDKDGVMRWAEKNPTAAFGMLDRVKGERDG